jgi:hypothetical protein
MDDYVETGPVIVIFEGCDHEQKGWQYRNGR